MDEKFDSFRKNRVTEGERHGRAALTDALKEGFLVFSECSKEDKQRTKEMAASAGFHLKVSKSMVV